MSHLLTALRESKRLKALGFQFNPDPPVPPEPDVLWIHAQVRAGDAFIGLSLRGDSWLALIGDASDFVVLEMDPTVEATLELTRRYIAPARKAQMGPASGVGLLAEVERLRRAPPRAQLAGRGTRVLRRFLGVGDYDEGMVDLENSMTFSPYLRREAVTQATGRETAFSQSFTRFSGALFGIERTLFEDQGWFVAEVQYSPVPHAARALEHVRPGLPPRLRSLPDDLPFDALGELRRLAGGMGDSTNGLAPLEELLVRAEEDREGSLGAALATVSLEGFDVVALPLFERPGVDLKVAVTEVALSRGAGPAVLARAAENKELPAPLRSRARKATPKKR